MNFYKSTISVLLLLLYSFGFTHNLGVADCNDFLSKNTIEFYHQHVNGDEQNPEHHHIKHNNHFDEGVYNYIVCLSNEANNSRAACTVDHCFTINSNDIFSKKISTVPVVIVLCAVFKIEEQPKIFNSFNNVERAYLPPFIKETPHRGPPII